MSKFPQVEVRLQCIHWPQCTNPHRSWCSTCDSSWCVECEGHGYTIQWISLEDFVQEIVDERLEEMKNGTV